MSPLQSVHDKTHRTQSPRMVCRLRQGLTARDRRCAVSNDTSQSVLCASGAAHSNTGRHSRPVSRMWQGTHST
jgi:hypothetical protein